VLIFSLLAVVIYANSLGNEFAFDDIGIVVSNKAVRTFDYLPRLFGIGGWRSYRPLRTISYAIDYRLFGLNPGGFRGFNIFYHVVNGVLLFVIVRRLVGQARPALLAAILFIVHPIQTDSVAYISGRRDLLFTLFYLIGFYLFIRYRETSKIRYLCLAGGSYYLGLLSKEMAVTLPLLCLGYDLTGALPTTGPNSRTPWQLLREGTRDLFARHKWFYLAMGAVFALVASYYVFFFRVSRQREMWGEGLWPTLLTSARIFAHYLKLLVFPVTLNADYSYNAFPLSYSLVDVRVMLALVILGGAWWGIYRLLAVDRWAAFGGFWFFVTLLPVSQIIPHHEMMAEHYLYLPSAGVFLTAALLFDRQLSRSHRVPALSAAFALLVLLLAARTVVRNRDWRDNLTLWTKTVQTAPQSARAHTNLGEALMRRGLFSQAEGEFREALRIMPNDAVNLDNHGLSLLRLGRVDEAEREFREALRILPIPKSQIHLGLVHLKRGRVDEAERQFRTGLNSRGLAPAMRIMALNNLGIASAIKGRREEAELAFKEAIRLDQKNAETRGNLGRLYLETRRYREAATELEEAIRLKRSDANLYRLLGEVYYHQGMKELAALELAKALSLKVDLPEARALLNKISRERASERGKRG
jgi:Flp pilus assembly protein TadD